MLKKNNPDSINSKCTELQPFQIINGYKSVNIPTILFLYQLESNGILIKCFKNITVFKILKLWKFFRDYKIILMPPPQICTHRFTCNVTLLFTQANEIQQLDGIEFICGRTVKLLLVCRTAGDRCDGHLEKCLQHQCVLHIRHQRDDHAGQRNVKVYT